MSSSLFAAAPQQDQTKAINDYVSQVLAGDWTDQQKAQMIQSQAAAVGVTPDQIAAATGYSPDKVNAYMALAKPQGPTPEQIAAAEQASRQARLDGQSVDPSVYQTLYSTNAQGQTVRNSDGYVSPISAGSIKNPNAAEYYKQNPQELFALGALGGAGGQAFFKDAGVRGTTKKFGQLSPDEFYQGYTSSFPDNWTDNIDPNYRWAQQPAGVPSGGSVAPVGGSGMPSGGSTAGSGGSVVGGMFSDYVKRPASPGIPSDYNQNQAGAGGTSSNYGDQMNAYYRAYFGDSSQPNTNMLNSWYGGEYSPTPTGFSSAAPGVSAAKSIVNSLMPMIQSNPTAAAQKLDEYRRTYGLSTKDLAAAMQMSEADLVAQLARYGVTIPVTAAAPVTNPDAGFQGNG